MPRGTEPDADEDAELIKAALEGVPEHERTQVYKLQPLDSHWPTILLHVLQVL